MMQVDYAISRTRRDLTVGVLIRYAMAVGALGAVLLGGWKLELVFMTLVGAWMVLAYRTALGSKMAAESPPLIAAGQYEEAERRIEEALRSFTPSRAAKLANLHNLAALRHAQRRWSESAAVTRAILQYRSPALGGVMRTSRLMLAEALLEAGDVRGAYDAIAPVYDQRLPLSEAMNLLAVQLDYQSRVGLWEQMLESVAAKVQLAELLPAERSARSQALLALAARRTGRPDWERFLRRRAELLADVRELTARRRVLSELWPSDGKDVERAAGVGTKINDGA
jgi:hypothetical protein